MLSCVVKSRFPTRHPHKSCSTCASHPPFLPYPLSFHILANSFAHAKNSTPLFSSDSELFAQNNRGWGGGCCYSCALRASRRGGPLLTSCPSFRRTPPRSSREPRRPRLIALFCSTPLRPLSHLSPLLPASYTLFSRLPSTTALATPFSSSTYKLF